MKTLLAVLVALAVVGGALVVLVQSEDIEVTMAETCLAAFGKENLKDPQGAYVIAYYYNGAAEYRNSGDLVVEYSAMNGMGGRVRGEARCTFKVGGKLDEQGSSTNWLLDRLGRERSE